ncbi:MAG: hypothetical protein J5I94_22005 [Phaeodactylibacter sp.]|nr:hypothetical protein [Phaeodactylibacter sp.]
MPELPEVNTKKLNFDRVALNKKIEKVELRETGTIKGFFLNQSNLAGMGNLYADEVCWQVHLHPASRIPALDEKTRRELYHRMQAILQTAIANRADYAHYPDEWLWNHREKGGACPRDGHELERDKVAGRSTYYCPQCQELRE